MPTREPPDPIATTVTVHRPAPEARAAAAAPLELRWRDAAGEHVAALTADRLVIGSGDGVDITVKDPTVSRLHAECERRPDGVWLRDLGSRNGTTADGLAIGAVRLAPGVTVVVGGTQLTVAAAHQAPPPSEQPWPSDQFGPLIGRSAVMRALFARLSRVAATDATVLVQGETGTGKELVARALHDASPRAQGPFIVVDCAALPENLLEAELFGHTRGAFTGAVAAREGAFEAADGGTLFLDEVGELPLAMQPKLLRALEARTVRRVGETAHRKVDVRFVSATHRDLRAMVNAGAFREDLYFRLAVVPVTLPPLRARPEDIPLLVEHFLPAHARGGVSPTFVRELAARPWLGNVRELRNFVERALALGPEQALALSGAADQHAEAGAMSAAGARVAPPGLAVDLDQPFKHVRDDWIEHLERSYIKGLLTRHRGNVTAVAQAAGLDRTYVHRLIRKHGL